MLPLTPEAVRFPLACARLLGRFGMFEEGLIGMSEAGCKYTSYYYLYIACSFLSKTSLYPLYGLMEMHKIKNYGVDSWVGNMGGWLIKMAIDFSLWCHSRTLAVGDDDCRLMLSVARRQKAASSLC